MHRQLGFSDPCVLSAIQVLFNLTPQRGLLLFLTAMSWKLNAGSDTDSLSAASPTTPPVGGGVPGNGLLGGRHLGTPMRRWSGVQAGVQLSPEASELRAAHAHALAESQVVSRCKAALLAEQQKLAALELRAEDVRPTVLAELDEARELRGEASRAADEALALRRWAATEEQCFRGGYAGGSRSRNESGSIEAERARAEHLEQLLQEETNRCRAAIKERDLLRRELQDLSRMARSPSRVTSTSQSCWPGPPDIGDAEVAAAHIASRLPSPPMVSPEEFASKRRGGRRDDPRGGH